MPNRVSHNRVSVHVIGVGGAGCNAVNQLRGQQQFEGLQFAVLNTDAVALGQSPVETKLMLGSKTTRGLGAGGDPERGRAAALEDVEKIGALCAGAGVLFVVAGLGGGTGTGASPVVARLAKELGALVLAIVILPFDCEGAKRQKQAQLGLQELKEAADAVICLPNQKVFRFIDENTSLLDAFAITNEFLSQGVRAIYRLLTRPGLINVDFADLCSVTRGKHAETSLATAHARGENRAREVVEKLLDHPLLDKAQVLAEATSMLVCIASGPGLTMTEVSRIMEQINRHCEHAHIIMGAAVDEDLGDTVCVTLLASLARPSTDDRFSRQPDVEQSTEERTSSAISTPPSNRPLTIAAPPHEMSLQPSSTVPVAAAITGNGTRSRKQGSRLRQGQLPLDIVSKGRFEKSEPTIHQGQDLDVPTYIRRGIALN